MKLLEEHAKEKAGLPAEWEMYRWRAMPPTMDETIYHELTGAVAPRIMKGKRAGKRNWRKLDKTTQRVVCITVKAHEDWLVEWERKTGQCAECIGTGQVCAGWSVAEGAKYRPCPKCKGAKTPNVRISDGEPQTL